MDDIIAFIRSRYYRLPERIADRQRQSRNRYMREYMKNVYRKAHPVISVTLTEAEHRLLQTAACASGRKPAAFLREAALAYLNKRYLVPKNLETALHALTDQLSALGNNFNQIAKHANTKRRASAADIRAARALLEKTEARITAFVSSPAEILRSPRSHVPHGHQVHEP
jgi:hypothetical protein